MSSQMNYKSNKFYEESFGTLFFSKLYKLNFLIIISLILLGLVGVASLYSAAGGNWDPWAKNHLIRLIFGIFLMLILAFLPYKVFFKLSVIFFIISSSPGCVLAAKKTFLLLVRDFNFLNSFKFISLGL